MEPVSFNETGAVWGDSPCTPPPRHGQNLQTPTTASKNGSPSHGLFKRLSFSALKSPLKSLGLRSEPRASDGPASPKVVRRSKSVFNLLPSIRSRGLYHGDPTKDPVTPERPKTTSPSKGNTRASKDKPLNYLEFSDTNALDQDSPTRPKRRKSFGDLLGTISNRVTSRYNTISQRYQQRAEIIHDTHNFWNADNGAFSMKWRSIRPDESVVEIPTSGPQIPIQQARHIQARESDIESLATRLERIVDG